MFEKFKRKTAANRLFEELLYEKALNEVESGQRRDGLWAKAFASSSGDEQKARALYLTYRVQSMLDELEIARGVVEQRKQESMPLQKIEEKIVPIDRECIEFENEEHCEVEGVFELSKIKSAIMRDQIENIKEIILRARTEDFMQHLSELIELADLFESNQSKLYLSSFIKK